MFKIGFIHKFNNFLLIKTLKNAREIYFIAFLIWFVSKSKMELKFGVNGCDTFAKQPTTQKGLPFMDKLFSVWWQSTLAIMPYKKCQHAKVCQIHLFIQTFFLFINFFNKSSAKNMSPIKNYFPPEYCVSETH